MTYIHEMPILTQFLIYALILYVIGRLVTDVFKLFKYIVDKYFNNRLEVIKLEAERKAKILARLDTMLNYQKNLATSLESANVALSNRLANIGQDTQEIALFLMALAREVEGEDLANNFFNYYAPKEIKVTTTDDEVEDA